MFKLVSMQLLSKVAVLLVPCMALLFMGMAKAGFLILKIEEILQSGLDMIVQTWGKQVGEKTMVDVSGLLLLPPCLMAS